MTAMSRMTARCRCGGVAFESIGAPIVSSVCYCVDCQEGSRRIEALPGAGAVRDADGGTAYVLFRKDRLACVKGAALLQPHRLRPGSATRRVVAACCNSAMVITFDQGPFWVSAYRARLQGDLPPLQMRICTRSKPDGVAPTADAPSYPGYPPGLMFRLAKAGLAMWLRR